MERTKLNYVVDMFMAVTMAVAFATGLAKWPGLHQALGVRAGPLLSDLHDWAGLMMGLAIMLHLLLHWGWIASMTKAILRRKR